MGGGQNAKWLCRTPPGTERKCPIRQTRPEGRIAVASYVATQSADLATMARGTGLDTLGYLLEMVRLEAESSVRQNSGPNGRRT